MEIPWKRGCNYLFRVSSVISLHSKKVSDYCRTSWRSTDVMRIPSAVDGSGWLEVGMEVEILE